MNQADTVWVMVATALVFFMTVPGLALFYGGMVRTQNALTMYLKCYSVACLAAILWYLVGYSIAFGDANVYWGGLDNFALRELSLNGLYDTLPEIAFFAFQMTFAIITPVLVVGIFAERVKFIFVLVFTGLWLIFVYAPVTHWVWGGGFLSDGGLFGAVGVRDFAGGLVVHMVSGVTALVLALCVGPRLHRGSGRSNPSAVMTGAAMLWVGWLGFNGGSSLAADPRAAMAIAVTVLAGASASLTWMAWQYLRTGHVTLIGLVSGTIAGLVAVTPASGYVGPTYSVLIGVVAGLLCQETTLFLRNQLRLDDALDVFAIHGAGGIYGSMMMAALGVASWNAQLGGMAIIAAYATVVSFVLLFFCKGLLGMRVDPEVEAHGLDQTLFGATPPGT